MDMVQVLYWLACLLAASSLGVRGGRPETNIEQQMITCYNEGLADAGWIPGTFNDFIQGDIARLHLHKVMWSSKPAPGGGAEPGLTIITAATASRLDSLSSQCRSWSGLLVASVYIPLKHRRSLGTELSPESQVELNAATALAKQLFARMEAEPMSCVMRLLLVYELVGDDLLGRLLPINSLRNTAMLAASTELIAMVDVDLLPSKQLSKLLTTDKAELLHIADVCKNHKVVVLPAFETSKLVILADGQQLAEELVVGGDKARVVGAVGEGKIIPFAETAYKRGHNATDFMRWYQTDAPYDVEYQTNYEPWFIVLRAAALLYDARFRGYGWNKATQVAYHNATGWGFHVHQDLFLVHRPHPKSDAQAVYKRASGQQQPSDQPSAAKLFHRKVASLRHVAIRQMHLGLYINFPGSGVAECMHALPWWTGLKPELRQQTAADE